MGESVLQNPLIIAGVVGLGAAVVVALLVFRKRKESRTIKGYAQAGNYLAAANQAQKDKDYNAALEYFLLAKQPVRAAQMARLLGKVEQAGEIYESAGEIDRAAALYREAGLPQRAEKLLKKEDAPLERVPEGSSRDSTRDLLSNSDYALQLDKKFAKVLDEAKNGSIEAQAELLEIGREAAEAFLAAGDTSRAAEVFRDAGLVDQAINVYVNLLGDFGAAGALFAQRGDHRRAADMYQLAGLKERALAAWVKWAEDAVDPLEHLDSIDQLGEDRTTEFLDTIIEDRPVREDTLDLHYRVATALEERKAPESAIRVLKRIDRTNPGYRDLAERIARLEAEVRVAKGREQEVDIQSHRFGDAAAPLSGVMVRGDAAAPPPPVVIEALPARPSPRAVEIRPAGATPAPVPTPGQVVALPARPSPRPATADDVRFMVATAVGNHVALQKRSGAVEVQTDDAAPQVRVVSPDGDRLTGDLVLGSPTLDALVQEVVSIAISEARRVAESQREDKDIGSGLRKAHPSSLARAQRTLAQGLGRRPFELKLVADQQVMRARSGPTVIDLKQMLGDGEPSLQNIEVWYRIGLAHAANAEWSKALEAFNIVEEISPGYRDAFHRAQELEQWRASLTEDVLREGGLAERYTLLGELGRGGMAVVYRARDEALGREVALKFLTEEVSAKKGMIDLFQREARAAAQLNHPNIVTVYDVGMLQGRAFIAMELVMGKTVEDMLDEKGRFPVMEALRISENILNALEYAHGKQIVHRDVKPSNIMLGDGGAVKLMDFGLAKSFGGSERTTAICGTPLYMAPEQFTGKNIDARTDLFALGAALYEMLSGQPPFSDIRRDIEPPSLRTLNSSVPKVIDSMVHRALEFNQARRFDTAGEMLAIVRFILDKVTSQVGQRGPDRGDPRK